MGTTPFVPLFHLSGFGPLGLPTDPAAYGINPALIASASSVGPSGAASAYLTVGGTGDSALLGSSAGRSVSGAPRGLWAASGDSKIGSVPPGTTVDSGVPRINARHSLKFASGRLRGSEIALKENGPIVIGRSKGLDIVLDEANVSGKHARLTVSGNDVTLEDLGSTGGTFVNGEKLKQPRVLREGDRIMIGSSMISLAVAHEPSRIERETAEEAPSSYMMRGSIEEMSLPDLLQAFENSRKNGVLRIRGGQKGEIHLRAGQVVFASVDGNEQVDPRKAFFRMVTWQSGEFELVAAEVREFPREIQDSIQGLLMEGFRIMDELGNLGPDRPPMTASVTADLSLERPLRDLSPVELDVIQSVLRGGTVQDVVDRAPGDDIQTTKALTELIRKGYVQVTG